MKRRLIDPSLEGFQGSDQKLALELLFVRLEVQPVDIQREAFGIGSKGESAYGHGRDVQVVFS